MVFLQNIFFNFLMLKYALKIDHNHCWRNLHTLRIEGLLLAQGICCSENTFVCRVIKSKYASFRYDTAIIYVTVPLLT